MKLKELKFTNPDWEETTFYYYIEKAPVINEADFVTEVEKKLNRTIDVSKFNYSKAEISEEEAETFLDKNDEVLKLKTLQTDWNISETIIEINNHFIYRIWETSA